MRDVPKTNHEKKLRKLVDKTNKLIQQAKKDDIWGIEPDSVWESVYSFDRVILTSRTLSVIYSEPLGVGTRGKQTDTINLKQDEINYYDESKYLLNWVKRSLRKGYKKEGKTLPNPLAKWETKAIHKKVKRCVKRLKKKKSRVKSPWAVCKAAAKERLKKNPGIVKYGNIEAEAVRLFLEGHDTVNEIIIKLYEKFKIPISDVRFHTHKAIKISSGLTKQVYPETAKVIREHAYTGRV